MSKYLLVAAAAGMLASADAFAPPLAAPAARAASGVRHSMTLAPERVAVSAVNLAKTNALEANRKQWGITEPLTVPSSSATAPPAPPAASKEVNKAKANALKANKEQWGITEPLSTTTTAPPPASKAPTPAPAPVARAYRKVSRDEVRALVRKLEGKGKQEAVTVLQACGYTGCLLENVWGEVENARNSAPATEYEKLVAEAETLVQKSTSTLVRADKLQADAKAAEEKIAKELGPRMKDLDEKVKAAEANAEQWGWFPLSGAKAELEGFRQQQEDLTKEISSLKVAAAEGAAGSEALKTASKNELADAEAKRAEAMSLRAKTEGALRAAAQEKLEARLEQWEAQVKQGQADQVKAALASPEVQEIFLSLALVPSDKYGATSLPGRVNGILSSINSTKSPARKAGGGGGAASSSSGDDADMTRRGALAFLGAALLGGAGYFATQNPQALKSLQTPAPTPRTPPAPKASAPAAKPAEE